MPAKPKTRELKLHDSYSRTPACTLVTGVLLLLFAGCTPGTRQWSSEILFQKNEIEHNRLSTGNSILLFPLVTESGFDTTSAFSPAALTKDLLQLQKGVTLAGKADFEKAYRAAHTSESLEAFYRGLFKNDMLVLTTNDSAWACMPAQFVVIIRLNKGVRISSFDGILKRKVALESEIWNAKNAEVVWRGQVSGFEMNKEKSDADVLVAGIRELFKLFPEFIPRNEIENW